MIQISAYVYPHGAKDIDKESKRVMFVLKDCAELAEGIRLCEFNEERDMLVSFAAFLRAVQPDWITGYNIDRFDFRYLITRAQVLGVEDDFCNVTLLRQGRMYSKETLFSSKARGTKESYATTIAGIDVFDILLHMEKEHKLRSYTLNAVSAEFLNEQKEDVHHTEIMPLFKGSKEDRRRIAIYCLKDALLPLKLIEKLMVVPDYIEMARVTGAPIEYGLTRGQQVSFYSLLLRESLEQEFAMPIMPRPDFEATASDKAYEGATVLEPKKGLYKQPIPTLDFASLYVNSLYNRTVTYGFLGTRVVSSLETTATLHTLRRSKSTRTATC